MQIAPLPLAISFDLDDTLWPVEPVIAQAEAAGLAWFERHAPAALSLLAPHERVALRQRALAPIDKQDPRRSSMRYVREQLYAQALTEAGYDAAHARDAFAVFHAARQQVEPYPEVVAALTALAGRYVIFGITNGSAELAHIPCLGVFRAVIAPEHAGAAKPDPGIYRHACDVMHVAPQDVLHAGDDALLDVEAARAAGLQVAWINRLARPWVHASAAPLTFADLKTFADALLCP